jgi:DNA-binding NtrC family response regulator
MSNDAILIIDDDDNVRDLVRLALEPMNVDVIEAATCVDGLAALRAHRDRIRLVLLDYYMPGMSPSSCASELRKLAAQNIIVLCTAAVDAAGRAAEVGLSRCLAKPFALTALEDLVRRAIDPRATSPDLLHLTDRGA